MSVFSNLGNVNWGFICETKNTFKMETGELDVLIKPKPSL